MAMTVSSTYSVSMRATAADSADLESLSSLMTLLKTKQLTSGTGNDQNNVMWSDQRTLIASATEDLDLAGVLVNTFGAVVTFTKIKAILIYAATANTNDVVVTRPAANGVPLFVAAGDGIAVKPDGVVFVSAPKAGYTVTADTGDLLTITNSAGGTSVVYEICVLGVGTLVSP